jgi:ABC-type phosphate transport system substrate-binding protein/tetratricopeptide (TPR) repeat protein
MEKTRKPSLVLLALLTALGTLPLSQVKPEHGLKAQTSPEPVPTFTPPGSVAEGTEITIDGTPSMTIINRSLEAGFEEAYPGTDVILSASGGDQALQALRAGEVDLAAIGRPLTEDELAQNLTEVPISREKIAIIVGRDNPFQGDLTFEDFARIFWGDITNWSQLGGPDLPLRFIDRPADSDTRIALSDYDVFQARPFETGDNAIQVEEDDTAAVVRELGNNGISYAIAGEIIGQEAVRPVSMHSTLPNDPRYPYSQPRGYVYQGEASIPVEAFLGYATNPEGQQDVAEAKETEKANVTAGAGSLPEGVAMAPDGGFMVRGTQDGALQWLDAEGNPTGIVIADAHVGLVTDVVISPDGQTVISSGADGQIRRWDRTGNPMGEPIQGNGGPILSLALSPDGQTLVSGNADGTVERWSLADGTPQGPPIAAHDGPVQTISYPPGGQNFITGSSDNTIALWNADGSLATKVAEAHKEGITDITSSPDGQVLITAGGDGTIRQWDRATLQPRGEALPAHNAAVSSVAVSPDGSTIATAGRDATLQLWDPTGTPQLPDAIQLDAPASSLNYSPDGNLVAGTTAGQIDRRDANGNALAAAEGRGGGLADLYPDLMGRIQNLPRKTWWMLALIPLLLILAGIIGALLGGKKDDDDETKTDLESDLRADAETDLEADINTALATDDLDSDLEAEIDTIPGLSIDFSGIGSGGIETPQGNAGIISQDRPPEADLVPIEGDPIGSTGNKLEQARVDLAEGKRLMREGRYDSALIYFNSAVEATEVERYKAQATGGSLGGVNAIAAQAQAQRGHALVLLGQPNDALDSYNSALEIDSSCIEAWIGKGRLLTSLGRFDEAVFCFDTAIEMDGTSGAAYAGRGQALMQLGRQTEARAALAQARALGYGMEPAVPGGTTAPPGYGPTANSGITPYARPDGGSIYAPTPSPSPDYDPDIPLELQQAVAAIPSEDMILPKAPPSYDDIPPELLEEVQNLASASGPTGAGGITPAPSPDWFPAQPISTSPSPVVDRPEDLIQDVHLPPAEDLDEMLSALDVPNMTPELSSPSIQPGPVPPDLGTAGASMPTVPLAPGDYTPPPSEPPGMVGGGSLADLPPEVLAAMASIPADSPDSFGPLPNTGFAATPGVTITPGPGPEVPVSSEPVPVSPGTMYPPVVPVEPGDFIPPPPDYSSAATSDTTQPMAFPPESSSWVKLSLDRSSNRLYVVWQIDPSDQAAMAPQGLQSLAIRLYDVTGKTSTAPLGAPVNQVQCGNPLAQDCYLAIPQLNRIYLCELGYLEAGNRWSAIAQSNPLPAIS